MVGDVVAADDVVAAGPRARHRAAARPTTPATAARDLRRQGRRVTARQRRGAPGEDLERLSGREREVAELVALGRTNREIAAELFLSEKTIETHLSHVFAKLGVKSRAAVAGELAGPRVKQSV